MSNFLLAQSQTWQGGEDEASAQTEVLLTYFTCLAKTAGMLNRASMAYMKSRHASIFPLLKFEPFSSAAEALKIFQQGSRNFMSLQASGLQGWADSSGAASNPCQGWTGVTCDDNNHVTAL